MGSEAAMQTQKRTSAKDRVWTGLPEGKQRRARTGIDPDLAWFLECGNAALGEKGTLGGIIAQLERGGPGGGLPNTHPYNDDQVGWGEKRLDDDDIGQVERHRWLATAWHAVSAESRAILLAHYSPPPAELAGAEKAIAVRSDEGYGAREQWVKGSHPVGARPVQEIGKRGKPIKRKQFEARMARYHRKAERLAKESKRTSVESQLGEFATLALLLCATPDDLVAACANPNKKNRQLRADAIEAARTASEKAHAEWSESKLGADPARTRAQRVGGAR